MPGKNKIGKVTQILAIGRNYPPDHGPAADTTGTGDEVQGPARRNGTGTHPTQPLSCVTLRHSSRVQTAPAHACPLRHSFAARASRNSMRLGVAKSRERSTDDQLLITTPGSGSKILFPYRAPVLARPPGCGDYTTNGNPSRRLLLARRIEPES